eukprot:COSAG06_NODE_21921_length_740_cov_3.727056_2_plen_94_part_00
MNFIVFANYDTTPSSPLLLLPLLLLSARRIRACNQLQTVKHRQGYHHGRQLLCRGLLLVFLIRAHCHDDDYRHYRYHRCHDRRRLRRAECCRQ